MTPAQLQTLLEVLKGAKALHEKTARLLDFSITNIENGDLDVGFEAATKPRVWWRKFYELSVKKCLSVFPDLYQWVDKEDKNPYHNFTSNN